MKYISNYNSFNENTISELDTLVNINSPKKLSIFLQKYNYKINYSSDNGLNKIRSIKNINCGDFGLTYEYKGFIYKLTYDKQSYLLARKLINKNYEHLVHVFDIEVLHNNVKSIYLIKMEKCWSLYPLMIAFLMKVNVKYFMSNDELMDKLSNNFEIKGLSEKATEHLKEVDIISQIRQMKKELQDSGLYNYRLDLNMGNLMIKNGKLCLIDFLMPRKRRNKKKK